MATSQDRPSVTDAAERRAARHPIRVVARRTGLKADLIRAWERRYGAISPRRSAGRHRFYTDADIERLQRLREATAGGRTISQVARLSDDELRELIEDDRRAEAERGSTATGLAPVAARPDRTTAFFGSSTTVAHPQIDATLDSIQRLDARALRLQLDRAAVEMGYSRVLTSVIAPLIRRLRDDRSDRRLRPMHRQLARFEIRAFVEDLIRRAPVDSRAPRLLVTTPAGQRSELGALLIAATAAFEGWDVTYLGCDLPADDIVLAARASRSLAVALDLSDEPAARHSGELTAIRQRLRDLPLLVGGHAAGDHGRQLEPAADLARVIRVDHLGELETVLSQLRTRGRRHGEGHGVARPNAAGGGFEAQRPTRPLGYRELPVTRDAFARFELDPSALTENGQLRLGDLQSVRRLIHRLDQTDFLRANPDRALRAGRLNALALLYEVAFDALRRYQQQRNPGVSRRVVAKLRHTLGESALDATLQCFSRCFPTSRSGWSEDQGSGEQGSGEQSDAVATEALVERLLMVSLLNRNPAASTTRQLFDDRELAAASEYSRVTAELELALRQETPITDHGESLIDHLLAAQRFAPDSLVGQIEHWLGLGLDLAPTLVDRLWTAADVMREEEAPPYDDSAPDPRQPILAFDDVTATSWRQRSEPTWMRDLVLVAKNVLVWMAQLSQRFDRPIQRLDQIPEEALDELVDQGFTGLWLIGIWRRSPASKRIKQLAGRHDVVASAYAIDDYVVAEELGGDAARRALDELATRRGLRLACDMVPNHTALDSRWLIEHPERFISVPERPFPSYTFTGEDLSPDPRISLYLEDHYADQSDAAVVFQRIDRQSGEVSFVYHGNDGSRLPWNDTAQLDLTRAEVRQALIETILNLAKRFSVLRLDAAMALVKEHVQRLWFPEAGTGGAVPSRSLFHTRRDAFDRMMPREFWREVVEAVERDAPGTLLLAEGFWYTEDYFIRELGMHRVYNSASMHMLRDRDNARFRASLENALSFDPAVLQCFANFLTNPDEPPAAEQFGTGDRYFAACTLLATLPGLPLFGHGQVDGSTEHYAMDASRPRSAEPPDAAVAERHRREIAPLLADRSSYADGRSLRLFDVEPDPPRDDTERLDDVFALTNGAQGDPRLVVVHNQEATVRGRIQTSVRFRTTTGLTRTTLADALGLSRDGGDRFCTFRDRLSDRWFVRSVDSLVTHGLTLHLGPWAARVFADFQAHPADGDAGGDYRRLADRLDGVDGVDLPACHPIHRKDSP